MKHEVHTFLQHDKQALSWGYDKRQLIEAMMMMKTKSYANLDLRLCKYILRTYVSVLRKLLVSATILPLIDYCSVVLIDSNAENDLKLQRAVNCAIRFIFNIKRDEHITPYRFKLKWLSVKSRRIYFLATYFYKLLDTGKPIYLRKLFIEDDARRSERLVSKNNNVNYLIPSFSTSHLEHSFLISAIRLWQKLPADIAAATTLEIFKKKMYDYLISSDF
ncbi:Protein of unknown function [Cotesia congregata]|uniref:Uncharacterized protein n=1 Tax=Cotesia congregata TaxID=51543 RepID=A0A8J2MND6_COTCN|nr:Protein of unknown function [Cotesia congregata]